MESRVLFFVFLKVRNEKIVLLKNFVLAQKELFLVLWLVFIMPVKMFFGKFVVQDTVSFSFNLKEKKLT